MSETERKRFDETDVERLAKFIAKKESTNCKTLDEALYHQSTWARMVPEAQEMLEAALSLPSTPPAPAEPCPLRLSLEVAREIRQLECDWIYDDQFAEALNELLDREWLASERPRDADVRPLCEGCKLGWRNLVLEEFKDGKGTGIVFPGHTKPSGEHVRCLAPPPAPGKGEK